MEHRTLILHPFSSLHPLRKGRGSLSVLVIKILLDEGGHKLHLPCLDYISWFLNSLHRLTVELLWLCATHATLLRFIWRTSSGTLGILQGSSGHSLGHQWIGLHYPQWHPTLFEEGHMATVIMVYLLTTVCGTRSMVALRSGQVLLLKIFSLSQLSTELMWSRNCMQVELP